MLIRPITKEEQLQSAQLFSIVFETPFDPNDLTPFARDPVIWAAFDEQSGEMASTLYVTDYRVRFDGGVYPIVRHIERRRGRCVFAAVPPRRRHPRLLPEGAARHAPGRLCVFLSLPVFHGVLPEIRL